MLKTKMVDMLLGSHIGCLGYYLERAKGARQWEISEILCLFLNLSCDIQAGTTRVKKVTVLGGSHILEFLFTNDSWLCLVWIHI